MTLTIEQLQAVKSGKPVRLEEQGTEIVILRADVFENMAELSYDATPWTDEEMDLLASEDADSLGWEGMEAYQDL